MKKKVLLLIMLLVLCSPISVYAVSFPSEAKARNALIHVYGKEKLGTDSESELSEMYQIQYCYYDCQGQYNQSLVATLAVIPSLGYVAVYGDHEKKGIDQMWGGGKEPIRNWKSSDADWNKDLDENYSMYEAFNAHNGSCPPYLYNHQWTHLTWKGVVAHDVEWYMAYNWEILEGLYGKFDSDHGKLVLYLSSGDKVEDSDKCSLFEDTYKPNLEELYKDSTSKSASPQNIQEYKEYKNMVILWCREENKYLNANDACFKTCNNLTSVINDIEGNIDTHEDTCGFSQKLIAWILKIFRWIKYLIPAIVIFLGVLDFIKATGSEKDDEMKKAQKHFVIRLIAAALIFVTPIIIEFILTKFAFVPNDCGIINL